MSTSGGKGNSPHFGDMFRESLESTGCLQWKPGLQALKKGEGVGQVNGALPSALLGGADIDADCLSTYPNATRWDYVFGYERSTRAVAHFVEVHSAESSEVKKMHRKLQWLIDYLAQGSQRELASLPREYHWVASGRINIPKHLPQYRFLETTLRKLGLKGPVKNLTLT